MGIRPFHDGRGFGPPYLGHGFRRPNFVPKFGASVRSSCPTESPINHPSQPARSEASAPAAARDGRESTQGPSQKGGPPPRLPGQRLAKRKARKEKLVKFSLCPMTSECSTAYNVWKSQQSPARAHAEAASIEQNGLEPHPAARQDASRARNCAAKSVFSFDGSTAVFFLARQKENGGGKPSIFIDTPGRSVGPPRSSAPTEGLPKSQRRADVPKAWLPLTKFRAEIWGVGRVVVPYGRPPGGDKRSGPRQAGCICKMKVDTHKSVGVYFFVVEYKEKDVGLWAKKEHAIESIAKMRK